jgi:hypothetical protein
MAAGSTYTPIATTTLGSNASTVTFSSIAGTYTDLVLIMNVISTSSSPNYIYLQYNGDTGSNYSTTILSGNGTAAQSTRFNNRTNFNIDYNAYPNTSVGNRIVQIMNYSNTTTYKTGLVRANSAASGTDAIVGLWRSTAAITSIVATHDTAQFTTGSTFTLYGIQAA